MAATKILGIDPVEVGPVDPSSLGSRPLMVFDIDGVLNRIPFTNTYTGPKCDCLRSAWTWDCLHTLDKGNWSFQRAPKNEDFFDDIPEGIEDAPGIHRDWQYSLWISKELTSLLKELSESGKADVVFLSMWSDKTSYLNGYLGTRIPYIPIMRKMSESEHGVKHRSLFNLFEAMNVLGKEIPPFTWTDDVVTASEYGDDIYEIVSDNFANRGIEEPASFILKTEMTEGIRKSHWRQLVEFVDIHQK